MNIRTDKLFVSKRNDNSTLFCGGMNVSWKKYLDDIACFSELFSKIKSKTVILYVPNNLYLFCVYFMSLLQAQKSVALPGMLNSQNVKDLSDLTDTIVTNTMTDYPGFNTIVPDLGYTESNWQFRDISNGNIYFFTSGSTGKPKRIQKTMAMLLAEVSMHINMHENQIEQKPVVVASIAPHHMYGVLWRVLFPICAGMSVDTDMVFTPEELLQKQSIYQKILFITTPSFLDGISRYSGQYNFAKNCIGIFTSGSLLNQDTSEFAYNIFDVSPFEIFGSTETGGIAYRQQNFSSNWTVFDGVDTEISENRLTINSPFSFQNPYLMSDAVNKIDDNHFELLGRADRVVKIAEERISLPDMESKLSQHSYILRAYCTTIKRGVREVVGTIIELSTIGAEFIISKGRRTFVEEIKKYLSDFFPAVALPRSIRIVNQIPTNPQGKFIKNEIMSLLNSSVVEPIMQNAIKTQEQFSADLTFLGDSAYFSGHFPGWPILPGVIQLNFVFLYLRQFFNLDVSEFDIIKLKFSSLILPDCTTHFELTKLSDTEFSFCYSQKDNVCSAGKISIKGCK